MITIIQDITIDVETIELNGSVDTSQLIVITDKNNNKVTIEIDYGNIRQVRSSIK